MGLSLLPGDDLLVVGGKLADGTGRTDIDYAVVKLTSHGAVDTTFGTDGHLTLDLEQGGDSPRTAIVQPDGKIVVSGHTRGTNDVVTTVLFRLLSNGQFDPSFGNNGVVTVALLASVAEAYDVALQGQNPLGHSHRVRCSSPVVLRIRDELAASRWRPDTSAVTL